MRKGIFIMSLNSKKLNDAITHKDNFHFRHEIDELDVFVFDTLEILNGIFLNEHNVKEQQDIIEEIISKLETGFVAVETTKRNLIRCSEARKTLDPYILAVYNEYYSNPAFARHCKNQVFQNLQPKLERMSISSNKSPLIEILIPFLVTEIALFLFIYHKKNYSKIYGMEAEMNILTAIREKKYPAFSSFINTDTAIAYIKITAN